MRTDVTESELKFLKENCRAEAAEALLTTLYGSLGKLGLDVPQLLVRMGERMQQEYASMTFPGLPPEYSDLYAAEFQAAVDRLFDRLAENFPAARN